MYDGAVCGHATVRINSRMNFHNMATSSTRACGDTFSRLVLVTGQPGVGKTTLCQKVCEKLKEKSIPTQGFYTQEVRIDGVRIGFDVITLDGQRGHLARVRGNGREVDPSLRTKCPVVGKYTVNIQAFEQLAIPSIRVPRQGENLPVFIVDEIGKMELFSKSFLQTVRTLINHPRATVLATVPVVKGKPIPLVEEIKNHPEARLLMVSKLNRDDILGEILEAVLFSQTHSQT